MFFAPSLWGTEWPQTLRSTKTSAAFAASGNFFATAAKASGFSHELSVFKGNNWSNNVASSCCFVVPRNKHKSLG